MATLPSRCRHAPTSRRYMRVCARERRDRLHTREERQPDRDLQADRLTRKEADTGTDGGRETEAEDYLKKTQGDLWLHATLCLSICHCVCLWSSSVAFTWFTGHRPCSLSLYGIEAVCLCSHVAVRWLAVQESSFGRTSAQFLCFADHAEDLSE